MTEFEFHSREDEPLTVRSAVFQALGAASTCWEDLSGTGVFDSTRAQEIGEALCEFLRPKLREVDSVALERSDDAMLWAAEFAKVEPEVDSGLMLAWFANAMASAVSAEQRRKTEAMVPPRADRA